MSHFFRIGSYLAKLFGVLGALCVVVLLLSECAGPSNQLIGQGVYSQAEIDLERAARQPVLQTRSPPSLVVKVDYSTARAAAWFPKGESPILAQLAADNRIPSVAERTGPEPLVLEGIDGVGNYGGAWTGYAVSVSAIFDNLNARMSTTTLVRWSPQGYPVVPHLAKNWHCSADFREYTFSLRKGVRWSDGHPFTADDIVYWWMQEVPRLAVFPKAMLVADQRGRFEKVDDYTVRFTFPAPNPNFIERLADTIVALPAHYLGMYNPDSGDAGLIEREANALGVSPRGLYTLKKQLDNPDCPQMWPWVYRRYQSTPPYQFVRNPYYWAVDSAGNQLPYLDMLFFDVRTKQMGEIAATSGAVTFSGVGFRNYTLVMSQRKHAGYRVLQWYPGARSLYTIYPNLNRRIDISRPETLQKSRLLSDTKFRRALSVAINRRDIIRAVFNGVTEPAQLAPGEGSLFHSERLQNSYIEYDPHQANASLDELGLTARDGEGFRLLPNGQRLTFFLSELFTTTEGPSQFVIDDWAAVGLRVRLRKIPQNILYAERYAYDYDLIATGEEAGESEIFPLLQPYSFVPTQQSCLFAPGYGLWFMSGGLSGDPKSQVPGAIAPPLGHPLREAMASYVEAVTTPDPIRQRRIFERILDIAADQVWSIGISTPPPRLTLVDDQLRNVPKIALASNITKTPANTGVETYYWKGQTLPRNTIDALQRDIMAVTSDPGITLQGSSTATLTGSGKRWNFGSLWAVCTLGGLLWLGRRYPFIGRRLLSLIPTLAIMSALIFSIAQLPPGDFLTTRIMQLEMESNESAANDIKELQQVFHMADPLWKQYLRWSGLLWFFTYDADDAGLLQGNLGRSMESGRPVVDILGDRILLTCLLSAITLAVTWGIALPIGIYSAIRQYSISDYFLSVVGFLGVSVPAFLLALLVMYAGFEWFGISMTGIYSPEFALQPGWNFAKVRDLLAHLWMPVAVLGVGGTAAMIRVMRGNLLDELRKPYVTTARAKGMRPLRLILKYPVRVAINPFISSIGSLLPELVSGGTIVAVVMGLPMVGPFLLSALQNEDVYLAASMLMVLSVLSVVGTLISDLLLLLLDPRIRMAGGHR